MKKLLYLILILSHSAVSQNTFELRVLGTVQDGGSPHIGCEKTCCSQLTLEQRESRKVSCISVLNQTNGDYYVFDATPDFAQQIRAIHLSRMPSGIFLTHAHIGHYTGLMFLGREAKGAANVPVYAMPRMKSFLENNGPWSQLVDLKNIDIQELQDQKWLQIDDDFWVKPIQVPHRDEFSETVGYLLKLHSTKVLFVPDIDKWDKWSIRISELIAQVEIAFIDATFYDQKEVKRDMSEIPHPFVIESMNILKNLSKADKAKVNFIHLNHSNPLLDTKSKAFENVRKRGFKVAQINDRYEF